MVFRILKWSLPLLLLVPNSCADLGQDVKSPQASSASQTGVIPTVEPTDGQLTCDELMSQMNQMDQIAAGPVTSSNTTGKSVIAAAVGTAAQQAAGFIPVVGPVVAGVIGPLSGAVANTGQQQIEQKNTTVQAEEREQHLLTLYEDRQCFRPHR
jgi:hypothetical protein